MRDTFINMYIHAADSIERQLRNVGLDVNAANALNHLISDGVFADIASHTSEQLVKRRLSPTTAFEIRHWFGTK